MNTEEIIAKFKNHKFHCGELIKRISDQLGKHANRDMQQRGITYTQSKLLFVLNLTENGTASLKEMEKFFGTAQSTMAGIAFRLEKGGFIESYTDPDDRRIKHLRITEKGRKYCVDMYAHMQEREKELISPLSDEEQDLFYSFLERIYHSLKD